MRSTNLFIVRGHVGADPLRYSQRTLEGPVFFAWSDAFEPTPRATEPVPGRSGSLGSAGRL